MKWQRQGPGRFTVTREPPEVQAADDADAQLKQQFLPCKEALTGTRPPAGRSQLEPIIESAQHRQPYQHDYREVYVAVEEITQQEDGHEDRGGNQDAPHRRDIGLGGHQLVQIGVVELGRIAQLLTQEPSNGPLAKDEDDCKGQNDRKEGPEFNLVKDLQQRVATEGLQPVVPRLKEVVEHAFAELLSTFRPLLLPIRDRLFYE